MADLGSTPNLTTLSGFGDSRVIPGDEIYVSSEDADFIYRLPPPTFVNDGVSAVKAVNLAGSWIRRGTPADMTQLAWFIDPTNGSDVASGDSAGNALKTDTERQRRWGRTNIVAATMVTYLGSPPEQTFYDVNINPGANLIIQGTRTQTKSGTFSAVTTLNRATQTPWDVTGTGLGAADVGKIIRITGGARAGNNARIMKDLTGGKVRTTPFGTLAAGLFGFTQVTPVAPDPWEVVDLTQIKVGTWNLRFGSTFATSPPLADMVQVDSCLLGSGSGNLGVIKCDNGQITYTQSILSLIGFAGAAGTHMLVGGGANASLATLAGCFSYCVSCGMASGCSVISEMGGYMALDGDCLFQNAQLNTLFGNVDIGFVSFFDRASANTAFVLNPNSACRSAAIFSGGDLIWGDANAGVAVQVRSGGSLVYATKPTVNTPSGAARQSIIGGTNKDWSAVPFVEPANRAMIVVNA